jgi:hypothetical protein
MKYQLHETGAILDTEHNLLIPLDSANQDYVEYLTWLEEGNEPDPVPEPEVVAGPTSEEKLAASGLTVDELKQLLGL